MASPRRAIGLFGGTFDPVHRGHVSVARSYLNSPFIDELYVLLTPAPPHKKERTLTPYKYRKEMLHIAFQSFPSVTISDVENSLPKPSYTIQTIRYLKKKYPDFRFYLCVGEDSLVNFKKWHKWEQILEECELLVTDRPNFSMDNLDPAIIGRTKLITHKPIEISSSEIRRKVNRGEDISEMVPPGVNNYIEAHHLYQNPQNHSL